MYSKTTIIGYVGKDPDSKFTPKGQQVTNFSVATSHKYNGEEETTWFRVVTWGKIAEACNNYVKKGMLVAVEGRLIPDKATGSPKIWKKQDGTPSASFELNAAEVKFLSRVQSGEYDFDKGDESPVGEEEEESFPF